MNLWYVKVLKQILPRSLNIFKWLIILILVLNLNSCTQKAVSQDVSVRHTEKSQLTSQQFTEVAPPEVIQELRSTLEVYRPQVTIVTPQLDETIQDTKITVQLQVKDLPIFKDPKFELGPHLHVILDNQPYIPVYDLSQPLVLSDLSPGTHTLRVFASRPWHESFKNEGAYAQTTFHIFTQTDDNSPSTSLPLLTYSRPQGSYGAEPILLDFYLTNAPLRLGTQDDPNDTFSDWRIRCTINGESFVFDRWQAVYLKGFKPANNWVKLEFLDNQGHPVKNAFNTTVRLVKYQPKGKDTLSKIVRGELKADEVRSIVDQSYTAKPPVPEPIPTVEPTPEPEKQPPPTLETPEVIPSQPTKLPQPEVPPTPEVTESPAPQPEVPPAPEVTESPTPQPEVPPTPEVTESPAPQPEVTPTPEVTEVPKKQETESLKSRLGKYFQRTPRSTPSPKLVPAPPEVIQSPAPEAQPQVIPIPQNTELPEQQVNQPKNSLVP